MYNAFRSFPSGHSATSMNGLFTVLQLLFLFIDSTFTLKQYQVRYTKSLFAIPFVTWVCFILGSRIVISAERKPCIVRLSSSTRGCNWRNGFRSAFFSLRCQTIPPVHANDQASGHGQIEAGIQSLLFRCHRIDHQCVFSCI